MTMSEDLPATADTWIETLNGFGRARRPCFFLLDFELRKPLVVDLAGPSKFGVRFHFPRRPDRPPCPVPPVLRPRYIPFETFRAAFEVVVDGLRFGNSFLTNLTFATPVALTGSLFDVYAATEAKYRIYLPDQFVCFSPETFVTIDAAGWLETHPMKGTAPDTAAGRAELMASTKEIAEHATIVDLMRNDLSRVAREVTVSDYRYLQSIERRGGGLVQTSSNIGGRLPVDWREGLGTLLAALLPAGSVSGAPKSATLRLIRAAEVAERGYYCGIAGYFDGQTLDSCVLIRYLERKDDGYRFRSGGGITALSSAEEEYAELNAKIRLPLRECS